MKKIPFIRILPAFAAGILIRYYYELPAWLPVVLLSLAIVLFFSGAGSSYRRYRLGFLSGIGIQFAFLTAGTLAFSAQGKQPSYNQETTYFAGFRYKIIGALKKYIPGKKEAGLAEALLIGYKKDLDKDLSLAYVNTGTVHIIAISGMHLGLIYALLAWLLQHLKARKWFLLPRAIIILALVWFFSLVCGAQPSLLRAAVMLSFAVLAGIIQRKSSPLNAIAGSAFILLCIEPLWLWDIGFQLSFAAVTGILLFYRTILGWYVSNNKLIWYCWQLVAVTLAAQVLTFPFLFYHFHQFPLLFIFGNLVAVPLSGLILLSVILLCSISFIPFIAYPLGKFIYGLIHFMNDFILRLDLLPGFSIRSIYISALQALLLFILIFLIWKFSTSRYSRHLITAQLIILFFLLLRLQSFFIATRQQLVIVHRFRGAAPIDIVSGRHAISIASDSINRFIKTKRESLRIKETAYRTGTSRAWLFGSQLICIWNGRDSIHPEKCIDILVVSGKIPRDLGRFTRSRVRQVVIDANVYKADALRCQQFCDSLQIACHNLRSRGTFVMSMR